jgi:hypothetical protein
MLFLAGVVQFFLCVFFLTKEKVIHTTLSTTYVEKKQPKTPSSLCFLENVLVLLCGCMLSLVEIQHRLCFQNNVAMFVFCTLTISHLCSPIIKKPAYCPQ